MDKKADEQKAAALIAKKAMASFKDKKYLDTYNYFKNINLQLLNKQTRLVMNLSNAAYLAAKEESFNGNYLNALELLDIYCTNYPGDKDALRLKTSINCMNEQLCALTKAISLIEKKQMSEAADILLTLINSQEVL